MLQIANVSKTMSSLEIAKLTGKEHKNVLADIRMIFDEAGIRTADFSAVYKNQQGKEQPCFNLPRRECDLVISGYSIKYRLAIIERWQELEAKEKSNLPDFTNPAIAARAWLNLHFRLALLEKVRCGLKRSIENHNMVN